MEGPIGGTVVRRVRPVRTTPIESDMCDGFWFSPRGETRRARCEG